MGKLIDLSGKKFGRLTVMDRAEDIISSGKPEVAWNCKCDCGKMTSVRSSALRNGHTKSCGCMQKESALETHTTHGMSNSRIYRIYIAMNERCSNPNASAYPRYGGRGISVCENWKSPEGFKNFLTWATENGYEENLTIERVDPNKGYFPGNCCWIPFEEQAKNQERTIHWEHNGEVHTISEWAEIVGISAGTLRTRFYSRKWPVDKCLSTPVKTGFRERNAEVKRGKRKISVWIDRNLLEKVRNTCEGDESKISEVIEHCIEIFYRGDS